MGPEAPGDLDRMVDHFVARLRQGEHPSVEDYARRHPDLADEIRELFPLLSMMEGVKARDGATKDGGDTHAEMSLPQTIATYEIVRAIGRGGMGRVHEGRAADGSRVAVKVIHPHLLGEMRYVARFLREAEIGSHIRHENVVRTLESGVLRSGPRGVPYIVLEYVEGQNLRELLGEVGRVPERLCRHIGLCVARALESFEKAGIVHRDLKPGNVVITPDEIVKVMDLGVARLQESAECLTQTGQFVGSFRYAAPEQLAGARVDGRADLYALGVLLFELATGVHPASAAEAGTVLSGPAPSSLVAGLSPFFDAVVTNLMRPAPGDRFQSASDLIQVLRAAERSAWWMREAESGPPTVFAVEGAAFHGRDEELDALQRALADVRKGAGRTILLEGEAGIGKSRLLREWLRETTRGGTAPGLVLARHDPGEGGIGLFPLGTALLEHLGHESLDRTLCRHLGSDERLARDLARHLRSEGSEGGGPGGPAGALSVGLLALLRSLAAAGPVIVVIEDLHFAGQATRTLVPFLARGLAGHPVLLLVSTRPLAEDDPVLEVLRLECTVRLPLAGLDFTARMAVLDDALGSGELHPREVGELARKSDGNPYFLLELATSRRAPPDDGRSETSVPTTLQTLLRRRLAALADEDRELLETAACCGYAFDPELLSEAAGTGLIATLKRLGRIERRGGLLVSAGSAYRFHHHLLQEVLYEELHPRLRTAHHAALGAVLLGRVEKPEAVDRPAAVHLWTHLLRGGRPQEAAPYVLPASAHFRARGEYDRGTEVLLEALGIDGLLEGETRVRALYLAGAGCHVGSDFGRAEAYLAEACELALAGGFHELAAEALRSHANLKTALHRHAEVEKLAHASIEAARRADVPDLEAFAHLTLARNFLNLGRPDDAQAACDAAGRIARNLDDGQLEADWVLVRARNAQARGDLGAATRHAEHSARLARRHGDRGREFQAMETQGGLAFREGRFADALAVSDQLLRLGTETGMLRMHVSLLTNGASCLYELGRYPEALARTDEALQTTRRFGQERSLAGVERGRALILAAQGHLEEARVVLGSAGVRSAPGRRIVEDVIWHQAYTEVLGVLGRFEEGLGVLEESAVRRGETSSRHHVTQIDLAEAALLERAGRPAEAWELLGRLLEQPGRTQGSHGRLPLLAGRVALRLGDRGTARAALEEALAWGRRSGCVRVEVPARVHLATLPGGDVLAARVELEQKEGALPRYDALEVHVALWAHTREEAHLERARALLEVLRAGASPEDRDAMVERVELYRRVLEA